MSLASRVVLVGITCWIGAFAVSATPQTAPVPARAAQPGSLSARADRAAPSARAVPLFQTADNCMACHNGLITPSGEDVSIGSSWRASMMANSARDPYWQAAVRREAMDHAAARAEIEHECSVCHMPMSNTQARADGRRPEIFAHLAAGTATTAEARLAADGVSCTICHQIRPETFGTRASFSGGYVIDTSASRDSRPIFGRFPVDAGRTAIMRSATGFVPTEAPHLRQSEMCATCHTLFTKALGRTGEVVGELPEQVPYLEWRHSAFQSERSCQSCHMPQIDEPMAIVSVLGEPRPGFARHSFRGGNAFMLRMLNRYRTELGVQALPQELDGAVRSTVQHLQRETAQVRLERIERSAGGLVIDVVVENLAGHKLPTGYPSRRAWLHVTVRTADGRTLFESGAIAPDGSIQGNDNDADATKFEPHYAEIRTPNEVQIYESVMADHSGAVTTGLLSGVRFVKDNRLLPRGFDKRTASSDIAVRGGAGEDHDFVGGSDRIRYSVDVANAAGPLHAEVVLRFQPIAFRWARNLASYDAAETKRFVSYFDSMAASSSDLLARAGMVVR